MQLPAAQEERVVMRCSPSTTSIRCMSACKLNSLLHFCYSALEVLHCYVLLIVCVCASVAVWCHVLVLMLVYTIIAHPSSELSSEGECI
jgi:hypothetical protein